MLAPLVLLAACSRSPVDLPAPTPVAPGPPRPLIQDIEEKPVDVGALFKASSAPPIGSARVPPPDVIREHLGQQKPVGEGWPSPNGARAAIVTRGPNGESRLVILEINGSESALLDFSGYPEGEWAPPRWSHDSRFLVVPTPSGVDAGVDVYDAIEKKVIEHFRGVRDLQWSPEAAVLALSFWPSGPSDLSAPVFRFYLAEPRQLVTPVVPTDQVGYSFVGFADEGTVHYREYRLGKLGSEVSWEPSGERLAMLSRDFSQLQPVR